MSLQIIELPYNKEMKYIYKNKKLTKLPSDFDNINCTYLDCSGNKIKELPELPKCKELNCSYNQIIILPQLPQCEKLDCSNNKIINLPILPKCRELYFNQNPVFITQIETFLNYMTADISLENFNIFINYIQANLNKLESFIHFLGENFEKFEQNYKACFYILTIKDYPQIKDQNFLIYMLRTIDELISKLAFFIVINTESDKLQLLKILASIKFNFNTRKTFGNLDDRRTMWFFEYLLEIFNNNLTSENLELILLIKDHVDLSNTTISGYTLQETFDKLMTRF